ncbi:hypothetical protein RN001_001500 [Aquatica leii]|uniref:Uncharacterized protein n=1 Tax=Aquatica leii TaxID=1421715 RepID=A0AAN7Q445_9COLE|nr:hypothetical protein RN001_001500 [Aquatica leii]
MDQYIQRSNSIGSNEDLRRQPKRKKEDKESEESKHLQLMEEILQQITALRQDNLEIKNELKTLKEKYESNEKKWQLEKNVLESRIKQLEDDKEREEKRKKKNNIIISGIKTNEENVEETGAAIINICFKSYWRMQDGYFLKSVRSNSGGSAFIKKDVIDSVKNWLCHASTRSQNQEKRMSSVSGDIKFDENVNK